MTHLHRIFVQKTSIPVSFSTIFPVCSKIFVSCYNSSVSDRNSLSGKGVDSKLQMRRPSRNRCSSSKFSKSLYECVIKARNEIKQWETQQMNPKDFMKIHSITGIMILPFCWGWVLFDLRDKRILNYGGGVFPTISKENLTSSKFDDIACNLKKNIPDCSLYIMENTKFYTQKEWLFIECLLISKLLVLLNSGRNCPESNVIIQKSSVINSLFQLLLRNERVAAFQKILRIIDDNAVSSFNKEIVVNVLSISNVRLKNEFVQYIKRSNSPVKESISLAFLLVLSYLETNKSQLSQKNLLSG